MKTDGEKILESMFKQLVITTEKAIIKKVK